jgi:hypothetical protein
VGDELAVVLAQRQGDALEGSVVGDPGEDHFGLKQRQEAVGGGFAPALPGLGEVLEAAEDVQALAAGF